MKERWPEGWKGKLGGVWKRYKFVLLILCVGAALLLWPGSGETKKTAQTSEGQETGFDVQTLERDMERTLSKIEGAGDVSVVLTLESGSRRILAEDTRTTDSEENTETVVVSRGSGSQDALLLEEIYPKFRGALVVCTGGKDPGVQLQLLRAVSALTGLSSDSVSICMGVK